MKTTKKATKSIGRLDDVLNRETCLAKAHGPHSHEKSKLRIACCKISAKRSLPDKILELAEVELQLKKMKSNGRFYSIAAAAEE